MPKNRRALFACDALQVIALSQLFVLVLQWLVGRHWIVAAGLTMLAVLALAPAVWASGLSLRIMVLAPSCVPSAPGLERTGADLGPDEMREMLTWPGIAGVAVKMMIGNAIGPRPGRQPVARRANASSVPFIAGVMRASA